MAKAKGYRLAIVLLVLSWGTAYAQSAHQFPRADISRLQKQDPSCGIFIRPQTSRAIGAVKDPAEVRWVVVTPEEMIHDRTYEQSLLRIIPNVAKHPRDYFVLHQAELYDVEKKRCGGVIAYTPTANLSASKENPPQSSGESKSRTYEL